MKQKKIQENYVQLHPQTRKEKIRAKTNKNTQQNIMEQHIEKMRTSNKLTPTTAYMVGIEKNSFNSFYTQKIAEMQKRKEKLEKEKMQLQQEKLSQEEFASICRIAENLYEIKKSTRKLKNKINE